MDCVLFYFFFFQAEDGIRDKLVTGVQTCALPISVRRERAGRPEGRGGRRPGDGGRFGRGRSRALLRDALPGTAGGSPGVAEATRPRRALAAAAILAILPP